MPLPLVWGAAQGAMWGYRAYRVYRAAQAARAATVAMASRPAVQAAARAGANAAAKEAATDKTCKNCDKCPVCGQTGGKPPEGDPDYVTQNRKIKADDIKHLGYQHRGKCNGSPLYFDKATKRYITLDKLHHGKRTHLETFNKRGIHEAERCPACGKDLPGTQDTKKSIKDCI